jgi:hypothetical protein
MSYGDKESNSFGFSFIAQVPKEATGESFIDMNRMKAS